MNSRHCHRIVLTGGPGGGKTTAADLFRRELGERVVIVPESATMLFSGGFPRSHNPESSRYLQKAIFEVQRNLEDLQATLYSHRVLLCDRGTIDGAAYWPEGDRDFFATMGTTLEDELARYDAAIYFESAAMGRISIEGGNPTRTESIDEAVVIDKRLRSLWGHHKNFAFVQHQDSFFQKIRDGLKAIWDVLNDLDQQAT